MDATATESEATRLANEAIELLAGVQPSDQVDAESRRQLDEIRELIERAETLEPENAYVQAAWGGFWTTSGQLDKGLEISERAWSRIIELEPDSAQAHFALASVLTFRDEQRALAIMRRAVALDPGLTPARIALAHMLEKAGDLRGALVEYRAVIDAYPDEGEVTRRFEARAARLEEQIANESDAARSP